MKRKIILSIMLVVTLFSSNFFSFNAYANDSKTTEASQNKITKSISVEDDAKNIAQSIIKNAGAVGIQYAAMCDGKIILSDSVGVSNKNDNTPIHDDTMFGIGSVSKMFTAAAIMNLVDEGEIDLDKYVTDYIPEFQMNDDRYKKITVRMLLNHSSGLMGSDYKNAFLFDDTDDREYKDLLEQLKTQRLKAEPGEFSVYCNDGFSLAQLIVERVSGTDFTTYIHENFTDVLGLDNTKTPEDDIDSEQLAKTYNDSNRELPKENVNIIGAGGIYSTAEDLCAFTQMFNDDDILSKESRNAMIQNEADKGININDNEGTFQYGLGWDNVKIFDLNRYNIQGVTKGGDTLSYHSSIINIPEYNISIAVLSSGGTSTYDELLGTSIAKNILKEQGIIKEILPKKVFEKYERTNVDNIEKQNSGLYLLNGTIAQIDIKDDGELSIYVPGYEDTTKKTYYYTSDRYYTDEENTSKCQFVKESNGNIYLRVKSYITLQDSVQSVEDSYEGQKIEQNNIDSKVKSVWNSRKDNDYLLVNEKYTSELYLNGLNITNLNYSDNSYGYVDTLKIIGKDDAVSVLEVPGISGRDMSDMKFWYEDGKEYMKKGTNLFISSKDIDILNDNVNKVSIDDGYAKWYKCDNLNKTQMTITVDGNGAFAVYDKTKRCINYSLISNSNTVTLENGDYVVFAGDKGNEFELSFNN